MTEGRIPGIDDGTSATGVSTTEVTREEPFDPTTYAELEQIAARYPQPRSGLLPMLHLVQSVEGRVTARGIEACAAILGISAAEVSGVATFYTMYKRRPVGDYHVGVCTNTLCAIMGGDLIFERLKDHLDIGNDETTEWFKTVAELRKIVRLRLEKLAINRAIDMQGFRTAVLAGGSLPKTSPRTASMSMTFDPSVM